MTALSIASAPCSFGVDEVVKDDAWMPTPDEMLDWMLGIGYEGTELGPPGYLGAGAAARERLERRGLQLVGAFLPGHFSRADRAAADRDWLRGQLTLLRAASPEGSAPLAVLCEAIDEPDRLRYSGRIDLHPEARLDESRVRTMMDNLHRAGELCREMGFGAVIHPHAGTYIETDEEIERVVERLDASLVGLCLDSGHFRYGGADPAQRVRDYRSVLHHVHLKDCRTQVLMDARRDDQGFAEALARGVFAELGEGDSGIDRVVEALREVGYAGWVVVEQDRKLDELTTRHELVASQRRNLAYLRTLGL
ncbi:MAG: sugar phosphate isomerase/epimerase [Chloroflexi bacterium]|nr:sugar phosphate isomerase/epimerase [Chloroflexota bacterium]